MLLGTPNPMLRDNTTDLVTFEATAIYGPNRELIDLHFVYTRNLVDSDFSVPRLIWR